LLPLLACSGANPTINAGAAAFYWRRGYVSPDSSAVDGVWPVPPGMVVEFDGHGKEMSRTRIEAEASVLYCGESAANVNRTIQQLLLQAVAHRLENNPHPMALLSGGVDSTIVTQIATDLLRSNGAKPLKVVTLGAMIPYTQDEYYARFAAKRLGLALEIVHPARRNLPDAVSRAISVQDEPLGMPSYFLLFQLIEAAAPHGKVVLTGDGGDEVFLGYRPPADWRSHKLSDGDHSNSICVGPGASPWMGSWAQDTAGNTLLGHMFTKLYRASAEQGVEVRCPLLDLPLMNYVRSLPVEMLCDNSSIKRLLKDQLADWPKWFVERRKVGFAYNLRWHWALTRFGGLREMISQNSIQAFSDRISPKLRGSPSTWKTRDIFNNFSEVLRLMVWSAFIDRLTAATGASRVRAPARVEYGSERQSATDI
jgi:asparagine synthetase B (glutamine-hydrolysing)